MKYIIKPANRMSCDELGELLGITVMQITGYNDGSMEIITDEPDDADTPNTQSVINQISATNLQDEFQKHQDSIDALYSNLNLNKTDVVTNYVTNVKNVVNPIKEK